MIFANPKPLSTLCNDCPLKSGQLCRSMRSVSDQFGTRSIPRRRTIKAETPLQEEDERPQFAGILRRGYLRTERILSDGRRSILSIQVPGDLIGDVFGSLCGPALVTATDVEYCAFNPATLRRALQVDASLKTKLLAEATKQNTRQLEMVWRRGALNSRERIIAFMVMAAEFMPIEPQPDGSVILTIKISRKDWADFSNTTVETICRTLADLAKKGIVSTVATSRYRIGDLGILAQLAGLDSLTDRNAMAADSLQQGPGLGRSKFSSDRPSHISALIDR